MRFKKKSIAADPRRRLKVEKRRFDFLPTLYNIFTSKLGDPWPAGGSADIKNLIALLKSAAQKTHNDISVMSFKFWCGGG